MSKRDGADDIPVFYSTFQAAKHFGVSPQTVINWVNNGLMQAHRTTGGHRRIRRDEIVAFARNYNYPLSRKFMDEGATEFKILLVQDKHDVSEMVSDYLSLKGYKVQIASSGFQAGFQVVFFKPDVVILDLLMSDINAFDVGRFLRERDTTRNLLLLGLGNYADPDLDERVVTGDFDARIGLPFKLDELLSVLGELLHPAER